MICLSDIAVAFSAFEEKAEAAAHNVKCPPLWDFEVLLTLVTQLQQKNKTKSGKERLLHFTLGYNIMGPLDL